MSKFNLAIDLGQGSKPDKSDRFLIIDIRKLNKYVKNSGFANYKDAVKFTTSYDSYTQLFMHCLQAGLVTENLAGKPFTYCYEGSKHIWKHYGDNNYIGNNKVLFKDDAYLFQSPNEEILKDAYKTSNKDMITLPITKQFLSYELYVPEYYDKNNLSDEEKEKLNFIECLLKELRKIINQKKLAKAYNKNEDYTKYVNRLNNNVTDIAMYLTLAVREHTVRPEYFERQLKTIMNDLCLKKDEKNNTYTIDNGMLYELATFYKAFNEKESLYSKYEIEKYSLIRNLEDSHKDYPFGKVVEAEQIDMFGNIVPMKVPKRRK